MSENKIYELSYLLTPVMTDEEAVVFVGNLRALIEKFGGSIISDEAPRAIGLAYTMEKTVKSRKQKFDQARFGWFKFEQEAAVSDELKKTLDNMPEIIRFMIISTVRENTVTGHKFVPRKREIERVAEVSTATPEEIDKKIEELAI
ncbi:hypothetical protein A2645_00460 [Candidatus Nomurabacteria bacterium RIFCSPHIGHO2_01_FULL_39_9]|uniref:Small ribosomal subunit protein bS6 n=1 Tax=Candidatus Nomurabacteria bacterium RIFCSPHIGHO2_01_FULL_39_9 TaxID=1801735 RepID=A0A1F6UUZ9_9BACT|nr:MAG: hypothetical protein A2645_00460 [Candidatus Nomurabacteria bacterium RIFCSPHIGHO2_01_FULL_39_9]